MRNVASVTIDNTIPAENDGQCEGRKKNAINWGFGSNAWKRCDNRAIWRIHDPNNPALSMCLCDDCYAVFAEYTDGENYPKERI